MSKDQSVSWFTLITVFFILVIFSFGLMLEAKSIERDKQRYYDEHPFNLPEHKDYVSTCQIVVGVNNT